MDDCNIVTYNLGLHYHVNQHGVVGPGLHWGSPKFGDDFKGAVTFLVDFAASKKNRIAVWR